MTLRRAGRSMVGMDTTKEIELLFTVQCRAVVVMVAGQAVVQDVVITHVEQARAALPVVVPASAQVH